MSEPYCKPDPRFCVSCGHGPLRPGIDRSCPGGDVECWDVQCPKCGVDYDLHFDGCVVRDARKRIEAENARLRSACEQALPFVTHYGDCEDCESCIVECAPSDRGKMSPRSDKVAELLREALKAHDV